MPRFSESLFESIRNFGRMSPTEGRRQALQQPTEYQQMGTTDPLARNLGKMFGGLGVDTSYLQTAPERIAAETKGLDMSTIKGQQQAIQAELQYVQDPQLRRALGLRLLELNKLKAAQEQRAAEQTKQKTIDEKKNQAVSELASSIKGFDPLLARQVLAEQDMGGEAYKKALGYLGRDQSPEYGPSRDAGTIKDEEGNLFEAQVFPLKNPTKNQPAVEIRYAPFDQSEGAAQTPVGKFSIVTKGDQTALEALRDKMKYMEAKIDAETKGAGNKELAKAYGQRLGAAPELYSDASESVKRLTVLKDLASQIQTGGFTNEINAKLNQFFGTTPTTLGEFQSLAGFEMVKQLKPIFGGNVSNSEAERLAALNASISNTSDINVAIIDRQLQEAERRKALGSYLLKNPTMEEFNGYLQAMYPDEPEQPKVKRSILRADGTLEVIDG